MKKWPHVAEPEIIKVGWRTLVRKIFLSPSGTKDEYVTMGKPGGVAIATIALTDQHKVVVAEQFRPGPEEVMHELPGGLCEAEESHEDAARRELHEETGYVAGRIEYLGPVYKDAYSNTTWHFFIAYDCRQVGDQHTDEGEYIEVHEITIDELFENARTGKMTDVEAVFLAYDKLKNIKEEYETTN